MNIMATSKNTPKKNSPLSGTAVARKKNTDRPAGSCEYAGETYSHGAIMMQGGVRMRCLDGVWNPVRKAPPGKPANTNANTNR